MIRRPPRSTLDRSSAASDVYKRQAKKWALIANHYDRSLLRNTVAMKIAQGFDGLAYTCLLYTSPSPRDRTRYRMPSSA